MARAELLEAASDLFNLLRRATGILVVPRGKHRRFSWWQKSPPSLQHLPRQVFKLDKLASFELSAQVT